MALPSDCVTGSGGGGGDNTKNEERANLLKKGTVLMVLPFWELLLYSNCHHTRFPLPFV